MKRFFTLFNVSILFIFIGLGLLFPNKSFAQLGSYVAGATSASGVVSNITFATLARGAGVNSQTTSGYYVSNNFDNTSRSAARIANEYHGFSVQANSNYQAIYTSFTFTSYRTAAGPSVVGVGYSTDGGTTWTDSPDYSLSSASTDFTNTWDFADFTTTNNVIFRVYGWFPATSNTGNLRTKDFVLNGSVSSLSCTIPDAITGLVASNSYTQSALSWTNGSCFDEILIVAKAGSSVSFTPSGDGSSYSANSSFELGTDVGSSQFVVYKGFSNSQTVSALTTGIVYYFKVFTRKGTSWSSGVETNATPTIPIYTWTGTTNGTWLTTTNWDLSNYPKALSDVAYLNNNTQVSVGINMNTLSGSLSIGALNFGTSATTARTVSNSSGTVSGILTIGGVTLNSINNTIIWNQSSATHIIANGANTMAIALGNSTENIIAIDGTGGITISTIISGISKKLTKVGSGAGILLLSGANTYTGLTTVSAGTLQLNRAGGTTLPVTNDITVSGGTLQVSSNQTLNSLTLNGGNVTVDNGVNLTINGALTLTTGTITLNGGTLTIGTGATISQTSGNINASATSSTVIFTNTSSLSLPTSLFSGNITNLTMNGAGGITLGSATTVSGTLTLTSGKLTLGANDLTISSGGTISGGSSSSYIVTNSTGALKRSTVGITTISFPIGTSSDYLPITAFSNNGTDDVFSVTVSAAAPTCIAAATTLTATWNISEAVAGGSNAAFAVQYNGTTGRGASFSNTTAKLFHCNGSTPDKWGAAGATGSDPYSISASGFTSFSPFGVSSDAVLPVELTKLSAKTTNNQTLLTWQTATEQNSNLFNIERSTNGQTNWTTIGAVKAAGNSQTTKDYQYTDETPLSISYYRLRSVDFDGKEQLSNTVSVQQNAGGKLKVFPTAATDKLVISTDNDEVQSYSVFDMLSRNVQTGSVLGQKEINIGSLPVGTYFVKVGAETVKFLKQ